MIRYGRRYEVIPVVERVVEDDLSGEPFPERLMHLPLGFIHLVHNFCKYFQTFLCHGVCRPAAGIGDGEERGSAPGACYLGEETMFDGVELGMPSFAFFECCKVFFFRLANLYWRFLLHQCNDLEINYKDTKISPVILHLKC